MGGGVLALRELCLQRGLRWVRGDEPPAPRLPAVTAASGPCFSASLLLQGARTPASEAGHITGPICRGQNYVLKKDTFKS